MLNCPVLIVEDDPNVLKLIQLSLNRLLGEAAIVIANDGIAALQLLHDYTPQVIVLDSGLVQLSSADLLHHILTRPHLDKTRLLLITAVPMRRATTGLDRVSGVLTKPIRPRELEYVVAQLLDIRVMPVANSPYADPKPSP